MASILQFLAAVLLLVLLYGSDSVSAVQRSEMDSMMTALRSNGYTLFSNAIVTSDLSYELVDAGDSSFTFFAPTDSSLFALDMLNSASDYTATLRCHVIPQRLSLLGLRRLPSGFTLRTLAADHDLLIETRRSVASDDIIAVDGVDVSVPGLFYGRNIAVHGLRGILNCRPHSTPDEVVAPPVSPPTKIDDSRNVRSSQPPMMIDRPHTPPLEANFTVDKDSSHNRTADEDNSHNLTADKNNSHNLTTDKDNLHSPDAHRLKRPQPSMNFTDDSSLDHSPSGNHELAPSPPRDLSDFIDPPSAAPIGHHKVTSPTLPSGIRDGFSPAYSPATKYLPPEVPQAFGMGTDLSIPTTPSFSPTTEIEPEFSEDDDPTVFPPSPATAPNYRERKKALLIENAEFLRHISVISPNDLAGIVENAPESLWPSDENTAACPATDESTHARIPRGHVYTHHHIRHITTAR